MNTNASLKARESVLHAELEQAQIELKKLEASLQLIVDELENTDEIKQRFDALSQVCVSLEHLDELGGFDLFLGREATANDSANYISELRNRVNEYEDSVAALHAKRDKVLLDIRNVNNIIGLSREGILEVREIAEQRKYEFIIEREVPALPFRPMVMPWSKNNKDEKLVRKYMAIAFAFSFLLWYVVPMIQVPLPDPSAKVKVPERLAKLLKKEEPKPEPTKPKEEELTKSEKPSTDKKQARKKAEKSGVLAFKDNFTELMGMTSIEDLGASAKVNNSGQKSNQAARNLVVSNSSAISGISSSSLSRNTGNAGSGLSGIQFSRVESSIGIGDDGADRPTGSAEPARSDEDIQIIFDRYKTALYRIYQRELRKDPSLQGNIVLRITIEANGSVSSCKIESSDIKSASLSANIIKRVMQFKFNAKEGAAKMTILYPIDFLPAT
ncbi:MAG: TonB family protein [Gammaproteobacteria bacterium]|nr:TonB family protein [Gammaproteobacteria bacterium]